MVRVSDDDINGQALYRHGGTAAKIAMFSKQDGALLTAQMLQGYSELYRLGQGIQTHAKGQRQGVTNGMTGQQGIDGGVLNGGKQHPLALQGFGFSQHLPQYPCVGTHGTAGGVVAGVGEEGGLAGAVQCGLQGLVWFLSQAGIVELMAAVPHIGGQLIGLLLCIGAELIGRGNHHDTAAGYIGVVADVAHMPAGAEDAVILFHLIHILVDGAHRFVGGDALLTAQN